MIVWGVPEWLDIKCRFCDWWKGPLVVFGSFGWSYRNRSWAGSSPFLFIIYSI